MSTVFCVAENGVTAHSAAGRLAFARSMYHTAGLTDQPTRMT